MTETTTPDSTAPGRYWCPITGWTDVIAGHAACGDAHHKGPCADTGGATCALPGGSCTICTSTSAATPGVPSAQIRDALAHPFDPRQRISVTHAELSALVDELGRLRAPVHTQAGSLPDGALRRIVDAISNYCGHDPVRTPIVEHPDVGEQCQACLTMAVDVDAALRRP